MKSWDLAAIKIKYKLLKRTQFMEVITKEHSKLTFLLKQHSDFGMVPMVIRSQMEGINTKRL